jgi:hypothetical protein
MAQRVTHTVLQQLLAQLDVREQQLAGQAGELAARLREVGLSDDSPFAPC